MDFFSRLENLNIKYNGNQKKAITHTDGPLLVAAGPGSGKTSVIAARCAYLIKKANVAPSNILVITFTKSAAIEMQQRFRKFPGIRNSQADQVNFGTFHSTFYRIINSYYGTHIKVLDQKKAYQIIKSGLYSMHEPIDGDLIRNTLNEISQAKIFGTDSYISELYSRSKFQDIYINYEKQKRKLKSIDFDDMMIICKKLLESDRSLLCELRKKYKYFLIDEFQDSNDIQFNIIKLLSEPLNNICVVGDDDQSIYSFRGAISDCLRKFENDFENCKVVTLDLNYRSTSSIVNFSEKIISHNSNRKEKNMKSVAGDGIEPVLVSQPDQKSEACFIANTILDLKLKGLKYNDFAVLYRVNKQAQPIIDEFINKDIPFNVKDSMGNFFDHWMCRDITCYLKLAAGSCDFKDLLEIINHPLRYISRETVNELSVTYRLSNCHDPIISFLSAKCGPDNCGKLNYDYLEAAGLKDYQIANLKKLLSDIKNVKSMDPYKAVKYIRISIGYNEYIRKYCFDMDIKPDDLYEILDAYESASSQYDTVTAFLSHIVQVSEVLDSNLKNNYFKKDCVTLSTIHSAKGLEFENVFIAGMVEGVLPHKKSLNTNEEIEEERRMFYVAATRAKSLLYISSFKKSNGSDTETSRFIYEIQNNGSINADNEKVKPGTLVSHSIFGTGRIERVYNGIAEIKFITKGSKHIDIKDCLKKRILDFVEKLD